MIRKPSKSPVRRPLTERLRVRLGLISLRAKLQATVFLLMLVIVSFTALTFLISTRLTETRILRAQMESDTAKVVDALNARASALQTAAGALAADPIVTKAINDPTENALQSLNARAVAVRDRFQVGLVQIYDAGGIAHTNLLLASLYRESSLLGYLEENRTVVREIEGQIVLLTRADMPRELGAVVTGVDLQRELREIVSRYRLTADIGMVLPGSGTDPTPRHISTREDDLFPFDTTAGHHRDVYTERLTMQLGEDQVDLVLTLSTTSIRRLTATGLLATFVSLAVTTAVLLVGSMMLMRAFARPVHELSKAANAVSEGNFRVQAPTICASFLRIGEDDELGTLTLSFNRMVMQLQDLYEHLEMRVSDRTQELVTAAEVARTAASSLDLHVILHQACQLIQQRLKVDTVAAFIIGADSTVATLEYVSGVSYPLNKGDTVVLDSNTTIGMAARQHSPCLVADTTTTFRYLPTTWHSHTRSTVTVPILRGSDVIGVLDLQSTKVGQFNNDVVHLLNTLADQIALGIQNAQRYAEEQRRRRFTEVLELTGRILSGSHDMQELPGRALSSLHALVAYDRGSLWMADDKQIKPLAQYGYIDERPLLKQEVRVDSDIYVRLSTERRPVIIDDLEASPWGQPSLLPPRQQLWIKGDRSWMGVPVITAKGKVTGVVCLASSEVGAFDGDDAVWVQAFASQAGIALENAQLYARISAIELEKLEEESNENDTFRTDRTHLTLRGWLPDAGRETQ